MLSGREVCLLGCRTCTDAGTPLGQLLVHTKYVMSPVSIYWAYTCGQLNVTVMCSKKRSDLTEFGMQNSEFGVRNADFGVKDSEFGLGQRHVR